MTDGTVSQSLSQLVALPTLANINTCSLGAKHSTQACADTDRSIYLSFLRNGIHPFSSAFWWVRYVFTLYYVTHWQRDKQLLLIRHIDVSKGSCMNIHTHLTNKNYKQIPISCQNGSNKQTNYIKSKERVSAISPSLGFLLAYACNPSPREADTGRRSLVSHSPLKGRQTSQRVPQSH